jgi:hypothetical protein
LNGLENLKKLTTGFDFVFFFLQTCEAYCIGDKKPKLFLFDDIFAHLTLETPDGPF